ncbi:MAG: hypothetical protein JSV90_06405 [Methanobacteriota archaeon]|nr:MAG: hypothetical protein JSV90_06405 [Euryarchaeota archaeon]
MLKQDIDLVIGQSEYRLRSVAIPPVKYWLLRYVIEKDQEDSEVQKTLEEAKAYKPRLKLLRTLREDGTWPISEDRKKAEDDGPGPPFGWTYETMLRNLYWLCEYCTDPDEGHVQQAIDKILSWQDEEGYIRGPVADMIPRPHYTGLALQVILRYGRRQTDPDVSKITDWFLRTQRRDGGWNIPYLQDMRYLPQYRRLKLDEFTERIRSGRTIAYDPHDYDQVPSCYWSTVGALRGMAYMPDHERVKDFRHGCNFVLNGFFRKNYHKGFNGSEKTWTTLKFPTYFGSGLTAIDCICYLGFGPDDSRMENIIRWLIDTRSKDGFWYTTARPHALNDQWITVFALMVLKYFSNKY